MPDKNSENANGKQMEEPENLITVTVKSPEAKTTIHVAKNLTVKEFKDKIATRFATKPDQLCLIFAGKIMKDNDTLQQLIKDGLNIHIVIKEAATSRSPATTFNLDGLAPNFLEMQKRMQNEILSNPDLLGTIVNNPLVQELMKNPELMMDLVTRNFQMQDLMEENSEVNQTMLQEMMRINYNALPVQEPILSTNNSQQLKDPNLLQQMSENPNIMQNMLKIPYMQTLIEALSSDLSTANTLLTENPLVSNNPAIQERIRNRMPQLLQQLQNPEIHNIMSNPQAFNAVIEIQKGIETLRQNVPSFINFPATTGTGNSSNPSNTAAAAAGSKIDAFSEFMAKILACHQENSGNLS